jgi:hypothetical protein
MKTGRELETQASLASWQALLKPGPATAVTVDPMIGPGTTMIEDSHSEFSSASVYPSPVAGFGSLDCHGGFSQLSTRAGPWSRRMGRRCHPGTRRKRRRASTAAAARRAQPLNDSHRAAPAPPGPRGPGRVEKFRRGRWRGLAAAAHGAAAFESPADSDERRLAEGGVRGDATCAPGWNRNLRPCGPPGPTPWGRGPGEGDRGGGGGGGGVGGGVGRAARGAASVRRARGGERAPSPMQRRAAAATFWCKCQWRLAGGWYARLRIPHRRIPRALGARRPYPRPTGPAALRIPRPRPATGPPLAHPVHRRGMPGQDADSESDRDRRRDRPRKRLGGRRHHLVTRRGGLGLGLAAATVAGPGGRATVLIGASGGRSRGACRPGGGRAWVRPFPSHGWR